ncbi:hypothetical protein Pan97_19550 [Bremerella volcania]|uniref:MOSC domain-containing protein n=1 Tax=Bremerella volcania TaxID=2527984 RepID=A0A518C6S8_9BACT|nr:MOSC domain-containing protein [Bremerella volcania]QDU74935.1 hypothetical protein Pan97_19550 [Bremerella volcania]
MTDKEFLSAFEDCTLPPERWTHAAHVRAAVLYASRNRWEESVRLMRSRIQAYNAATDTPEELERGYHETLTLAFMRLIYAAHLQDGTFTSAAAFMDRHPELLDKKALLRYYSRERILTWDAKQRFVPPDLHPLPNLIGETMPEHLTLEQLHEGLPHIQQSPSDEGTLEAIVIRPKTNERSQLAHCELSLEGGVHGDNWALGCWKSLPDGSPHPDVQVAIANTRAIDLIAGDPGRWALAGDNLYVDFDLSAENLPAGQQLAIGDVVLEITEIPHNGCKKFSDRFGSDAVKFVNSAIGKQLHLRGIYARVVKSGVVRVGDAIRKLSAT